MFVQIQQLIVDPLQILGEGVSSPILFDFGSRLWPKHFEIGGQRVQGASQFLDVVDTNLSWFLPLDFNHRFSHLRSDLTLPLGDWPSHRVELVEQSFNFG